MQRQIARSYNEIISDATLGQVGRTVIEAIEAT